MQLALAYLLAFGTRKDDEESSRWLSESGKASLDLQNHIRRIEKHERQYESFYTLIFSDHYKYTDLISTMWSDRYQTEDLGLLPKALVRYQDETHGKTILQNQDLHSLGFLLGTLGDIYMAYCLFDLAADSYREAAKKDFVRSMRKGLVAKVSDLSLISDQRQKTFVLPLAIALNAQGKEAEAIVALKSIKPLSNNPNGKESFWFSRDFTENRNIAGRGLLVHLLLKQQLLDEVTRLDIVNDLRDSLDFRIAGSKEIDFGIANVWTFVKALIQSGNLSQAVDNLRRFSAVLQTTFGAISPEALVAKAEMAFVLSLRGRLRLDEGLSLQRLLIDSSILPERDPRLLLLQAQHAYALIRDNKANAAFQCLEHTMRIKQGLGERHFISMGCMATLHNSLSCQTHTLQAIPFRIQQDMFELCKRVVHPDLQIALMGLLSTFARFDGLELAVLEMKSLLGLVARRRYNEPREKLLVQYHLSFMLVHWGFEYESVERIEEAIDLLSDSNLPAAQTYGSTSPEYAYFAQLLASAYGRKNRILCRLHGFGIRDINYFDQTVSVHQQTVETVRHLYDELNPESITSLGELAVVLMDQGIVMGDSVRQLEAGRLLEQITNYSDRIPSQQRMPTLQAAQNLVALRLHQNRCTVSELYDAEMKIMAWQSELPETTYPCIPSRMKELGQIYLGHRLYNSAAELLGNALAEQRKYLSNFTKTPDQHPVVLGIIEALVSTSFSRSEVQKGFQGLTWIHTMSRLVFTDPEREVHMIRYRASVSRGLCDQLSVNYQGLRVLEQVYDAAQRLLGENHTRTIGLAERLASLLFSEGRRLEALAVVKAALNASVRLLRIDHIQTRHLWNIVKAKSGTSVSSLELLESEAADLLISMLPLKSKLSRDHDADLQQVIGCATRVASSVNILGPNDLFTKEAIAVLKQKCSNIYHLKDEGENLVLRLCAVSASEPRDPGDR